MSKKNPHWGTTLDGTVKLVLFNQPFAGSAEFQPGAVHEQMQRTGTGPPERRHLQRLGPAAQRGMVRRGEIKSEQSDDGADQPLGLPQRQAKDRAQRRLRGDRHGGIMRLAAWCGSRLRAPRLDRLVCKPQVRLPRRFNAASYSAQFVTRYRGLGMW